MKHGLTALALTTALLLGACSSSKTPMPSATPAPLPTAAATDPAFQSPPAEPAFQSPVPRDPAPDAASPERAAASMAIEDLAGRLGVAPEAIAVVEINETDWPDASLGCPAPDMGYAQVITPGVQVVLESGGQTYSYHGRSLDDLFLCGPEGPVP